MFAEEVKDFQPSIQKCSSGSVPELGTRVTEETEIYSLSLKEPQSFGGVVGCVHVFTNEKVLRWLEWEVGPITLPDDELEVARWVWKGKEAMGGETGW